MDNYEVILGHHARQGLAFVVGETCVGSPSLAFGEHETAVGAARDGDIADVDRVDAYVSVLWNSLCQCSHKRFLLAGSMFLIIAIGSKKVGRTIRLGHR